MTRTGRITTKVGAGGQLASLWGGPAVPLGQYWESQCESCPPAPLVSRHGIAAPATSVETSVLDCQAPALVRHHILRSGAFRR
ncbi:uncharacterized protein N7511_001378 [Penicillium nucicola]|uniref:uncharacterized protein n=1 Tax=Penicillium nucicola TaxID=1850975 RepID=UPI00254581BD|nr:uncharacterized protein N7511_001378 [Penicillium nucicola]KAJ5776367.1 hypothetical protein N7511_001378 [Penicillium nucicola]